MRERSTDTVVHGMEARASQGAGQEVGQGASSVGEAVSREILVEGGTGWSGNRICDWVRPDQRDRPATSETSEKPARPVRPARPARALGRRLLLASVCQ